MKFESVLAYLAGFVWIVLAMLTGGLHGDVRYGLAVLCFLLGAVWNLDRDA